MSFNPPSITPSFGTDREQEDQYWRQKQGEIGRGNVPSSYTYSFSKYDSTGQRTSRSTASEGFIQVNGLKNKIGDFFTGSSQKDLPLYKDKPHHSGRRRNVVERMLQGKWRRWGIVASIAVVVLWWLGIFSSSQAGHPEELSSTPRSWFAWLNPQYIDWDARRNEVRRAFTISWDDYAKHAWGMDEYSPISKSGQMLMTPTGSHSRGNAPMGWIIVDALDTAIMMNLTSRVAQARQWIAGSLDFAKADGEISTFETTIRVLGGLLSAHYLSTTFPHLAAQQDDDAGAKGEDLYIEKAVDLADRILGAFDTLSGIPASSFNPNTSLAVQSHDSFGISSTAEATTLQLELKYLSRLTGEPLYWEKAQEVMKVVAANKRDSGLVPIFVDPSSGRFSGQNIRLGSRGDSYYEYLIKQYLQTGKREAVYEEMWNEALEGMKEHLITFTRNGDFTVLGERPDGLQGELSPKMDHLVCFLPGTIALGVTHGETVAQARKRMGSSWGAKQEEDLVLAEELMKTCEGMYAVTPTGLAAEITYFLIDEKSPRRWNAKGGAKWKQPRSIVTFTEDDSRLNNRQEWRTDFDIHANDVHNLQRPEFVESLFYMYRITRDEKYRHWGWEIFESFMKHAAVHDAQGEVTGYTSLDSVMELSSKHPVSDSRPAFHRRDNMEGFWLAETLKYLYLLFSDEKSIPDDWFDLTKIVINTEAHFFPRFDIQGSPVFTTGWDRSDLPSVEEIVKSRQEHLHDEDQVTDHNHGGEAGVDGGKGLVSSSS